MNTPGFIQIPNLERYSEREEKPRIIINHNLLFKIYSNCVSENYKAVKSILALIYSKKIIPYIEDRYFKIVKDYIENFAGSKAKNLISTLDENFRTYTITLNDFKRASQLKMDSFSTAISVACAERLSIEATITESTEVTYKESNIYILGPKEFIARYNPELQIVEDSPIVPLSTEPPAQTTSENENAYPEAGSESLLNIKFGDWNVEFFETTIQQNSPTRAKVILWNKKQGKTISRDTTGNGPIDALVKAFNLAMKEADPQAQIPPLRVDGIKLKNDSRGSDSLVLAETTLYSEKYKQSFKGSFKHTDTVKAIFCACLDAISTYINSEYKEKNDYEQITSEIIEDKYDSNTTHRKVNLLKVSLVDKCLAGINFEDVAMYQCNLSGTIISNGSDKIATWRTANINSCDLSGIKFDRGEWNRVDLSASKLKKAYFADTSIVKTTISSSHLNEICLDNARIYRCYLLTSVLKDASFREVSIGNTIFIGTNLECSQFNNSQIAETYFEGTNLTNSSFEKAKLRQVNFIKTNLSKSSFVETKLCAVSFAMSDLTEVDFGHCDLTSVDFTGAKLNRTKFRGAKITREQLKSAHDDGAILDGAEIEECSLELESREFRTHSCF